MATEREIANYLSHRDQDSNKCLNTLKQYNRADKIRQTITITITANKETTKITTTIRKTITRQDRLGETPEIGQEDITEMYANYVEKKDIQQ